MPDEIAISGSQESDVGSALASRIQVKELWIGFTIFLYSLTLLLPSLDRYFTWDEAVFFSQSGGLNGAGSPPLRLVASREVGSSWLIGVVRNIADGLTEVRFVWATITFSLLVYAAHRLARHIGSGRALTFLVTYGSFWLVIVFSPSFYANALFAVFALLTATFYLELDDPTPTKARMTGLGIGISYAAAFAMRPLEAALLAAALILHFALLNTVRLRKVVIPASIASITALLLVGVPWALDSINRFGSISERIQSAMSQPGQVRSGLRFNLDDYLGVWVGDYVSELAFGPVPQWPRWIIFAGMLIAVIAIAVALTQRGLEALRGAPGLFLLAGSAHASFFVFWREAVADRYHFGSMIFFAALLAWALGELLPSKLIRQRAPIFALAAVAWLVPQVVLAVSYDAIRSRSSEQVLRVAQTMRTLSNSGPCQAQSRYGAPQVQVASGCTVASYQEWDGALDRIGAGDANVPTFIYGPERDDHFTDLPTGWNVIDVTLGEGEREFRLAYWLPEDG